MGSLSRCPPDDDHNDRRRAVLAQLAVPEDLRDSDPASLVDFIDGESNQALCLNAEDVEGSVALVLRSFRLPFVTGTCLLC